MPWPFHHKAEKTYWLKVFGLYAATEAAIQLVFLIVLNTFGGSRISILEFHLVMLVFQCGLIWPIWWVARAVRKKHLAVQVLVNFAFYIAYTWFWFGPVQDAIGFVYNHLQNFTRPAHDRQVAYLDRGFEYSYLNYQMLKHAFRLSWYYLAAYFYNYRLEERQRIRLAVANKELQLKMLKWHLNPSFYFKTIRHLQRVALDSPQKATEPILQLAKVMEYVIYETKEKAIPVKKEIQFLTNYVQLLNQQNGHSRFRLEAVGHCGQLKISPLLLAGVIDKLAVAETIDSQGCRLHLRIEESEMALKMEGPAVRNFSLNDDDPLRKRLEELYADRFRIDDFGDHTTLTLVLDEEG